MDLAILSQTNQFMHYDISTKVGGFHSLATFIYGSNDYRERTELWHNIQQLKSPTPWVLLGDFNALDWLQQPPILLKERTFSEMLQ